MAAGKLMAPLAGSRRGLLRGLLAALAIAAKHGEAYLSTSGAHIVQADDPTGRVQLACVNWYGIDQRDMVVGGLEYQPLDTIAALVVAMGFNCVRLPFSLEAVLSNPVVPAHALTANPAFIGGRALDLMDAAVASLAREGLYVVLDNHVGRADWCCDARDGDGLWYVGRRRRLGTIGRTALRSVRQSRQDHRDQI